MTEEIGAGDLMAWATGNGTRGPRTIAQIVDALPDEMREPYVTLRDTSARLWAMEPKRQPRRDEHIASALATEALAAAQADGRYDFTKQCIAAVAENAGLKLARDAHRQALVELNREAQRVTVGIIPTACAYWTGRLSEIVDEYGSLGELRSVGELDARRAGGDVLSTWEAGQALRDEHDRIRAGHRAARQFERSSDQTLFELGAWFRRPPHPIEWDKIGPLGRVDVHVLDVIVDHDLDPWAPTFTQQAEHEAELEAETPSQIRPGVFAT